MFDLKALLEQGDRTDLHIPHDQLLDIPLARKTIEHIEAHPEEWEQSEWICKTGMCYAGHSAHFAGAEAPEGRWGDALSARVTGPAIDEFSTPYDGWVHISDYAQHVLGLADGEAARMFWSDNSLDDLRGMVTSLEVSGHLADWGVQYWLDEASGKGWSEWVKEG